jgi:hypothetical protein
MEEFKSVVAPTEVIFKNQDKNWGDRAAFDGTYIWTVGWERRRESSAILVDVAIVLIETAVIVSRVVSVRNTRVTRGKDNTDTLQRQLHPLTALSFLVESRKRTFNLAVRDRDNVADWSPTTL